MEHATLERVIDRVLAADDPVLTDMEARHLIARDIDRSTLAPLLSQYKARKAYLSQGPALHIIVVSLRCHHTCSYCQVSRKPTGASSFDMSEEVANTVVERLFEWPSHTLTVELQGGEPLLHFERVHGLLSRIIERNQREHREIRFVIASTLHDLTDEQVQVLKTYNVQLSTSLDGPEALHNANRPRPERDSHARTLAGIERARATLGPGSVSALTTITRRSLEDPLAIIHEYRRRDFHSISLRPLSPYGFARKTVARTGYSIDEFLAFYRKALEIILSVNHDGYELEEGYASLLLSQLHTPFSHGYVDLRSPTGAGLGAVVYDYDGQVYPSDEARMLAAMGDTSFALGRVEESPRTWLSSPAMRRILDAGVAEALPGCSDCAYVPLCGADPIDHYARQGDPVGHRPTSDFCRKQMGMFDLLLERWELGSDADRRVLEQWALKAPRSTPSDDVSEAG